MNRDIMRKPKSGKWTSGPIIILFLFLFFPIGICLAYKRASTDRKAAITIGNITIVMAALFLLQGIADIGESNAGNIVSLCLSTSIIAAIGIYTRNSAKKLLRYIPLVVDKGNTSIQNIADSLSVSYEKAREDLNKLICAGYFNGAYIDENIGEIVFPEEKAELSDFAVQVRQKSRKPQTVVCKSCGANNKVMPGIEGECEYCRSPISI